MKYLPIALLLTALFFSSCEKDPVDIPSCENCNFTCIDSSRTDIITNDCPDDYSCTFRLRPDSRVDVGEFEGVAEGEKNVFFLMLDTEGDLQIADDELTLILVFELEESQTSFSAEGSELNAMKAHYRRVCYCTETSFIAPASGCMQGERQPDGSWVVQGNWVVPYAQQDLEVVFEARFD